MSSKRYHTLILGLLASLGSPAALAQDAAKALLEQGQYWQARGNSERAAEAWQKLLRLNPNQPEALYGLAQAELDAKRPDGAVRYLAQLRRASPGSPLIARLEQDINISRNSAQLEAARQLARSGQAAQALDSYQAALGDKAPTGPLALEYYQTLGGTAGGWDEARRGLERLAQESPEDPHVALALAQHLTYRESTRREGIAQLERLAGRPDVGKAATDSWRKALAWTGSRGADVALYQAFLRANPGDTAMQTRLREIKAQQREGRAAAVASADPLRQRSAEGFKALDDGDLEAAEAQFRSVLETRPNDGDALGGMGVLRLRQENFAQARDYLERASRQGSAARWKTALDSANYWTLIGQAGAARDGGDRDAARRLLEQAVRLNPREVTAENNLADVLAESGQYDAAEVAYRRVLARQADNPDAIRGLVGVLAQNGKAAEALQLIERLSPSQQEKVGALGRLRATQAMGQARAAAARGDDNAARVALEDALLNDPGNPWVRLDLARLYLKMGAANEARGVMDGLLISNPDMPEALYASALLASEAQDWQNSLATLERIPEQNRTRDIAALQKRVWAHVQADAASALGRQGRMQEAQAALAQAEPFIGQDAELLGTVAMAYADAGDPNRALGMIRQVLARTPRPDTGMRLQYAATLLKTRQDVELAGILRQLQNAPMSAQERRSYDDLRMAYIVRQADALREAGDLAAAYDTLAPVLAERPNDPQAIGALARMYAANNDYQQALGLYNRLLEKDPNNVHILLPAATMATAAKEYGYAESALQIALLRAPNDPEVLTAAGRLYRAQGKTTKAGEYFAAAVAAENRQRGAQLAASGAPGPAASSNPFRRTQQPVGMANWGWGMPPQSAAPGAAYVPTRYVQQPAPAQPVAAVQPYIPDPAGVRRFAPPPASQAYAAPALPTPAGYYPESYAQPAPANATTRSDTMTTGGKASAGAAARSAASRSAAPAATSQPTSQPAPTASPAPAYPPAAANTSAYLPAPVQQLGASAYYAGGYQPYAAPTAAQPYPAAAPSPWVAAGYPALTGDGAAQQRPRTAFDELTEVQQSQTPVFSVGVVGRARQGESGMSQLTDLEAPVQMKFGAGDGMLSVRITPTTASAGTPDLAYGNLSRFGSGPATALDAPTRSPGSQKDSGIGIGVGYETDQLQVDVGTTPLGFREADIAGGVKYRMPINEELGITGQLSRRPVTDSLLSFAGARDARTGEKWGGVSATGGRLDLTWDDGNFGVYGYGSLHDVTGTNVKSNTRAEGGGGLYWRLQRTLDSAFTTGLNLTAMSYDKNLRYFTYGQGGYFSPQQFLSLSVPFDWAQRTGRLSYQINGGLGVQYFKEDSSPYFPTSSSRQAGAAQAASDAVAFGETGANSTAIYPGQNKTGLGYNLGLAMEYQMHPQLFIGGHLALDNARDYRQFVGGLYVRYALHPYTGKQSLPVNPIKSPYTPFTP